MCVNNKRDLWSAKVTREEPLKQYRKELDLNGENTVVGHAVIVGLVVCVLLKKKIFTGD